MKKFSNEEKVKRRTISINMSRFKHFKNHSKEGRFEYNGLMKEQFDKVMQEQCELYNKHNNLKFDRDREFNEENMIPFINDGTDIFDIFKNKELIEKFKK